MIGVYIIARGVEMARTNRGRVVPALAILAVLVNLVGLGVLALGGFSLIRGSISSDAVSGLSAGGVTSPLGETTSPHEEVTEINEQGAIHHCQIAVAVRGDGGDAWMNAEGHAERVGDVWRVELASDEAPGRWSCTFGPYGGLHDISFRQ